MPKDYTKLKEMLPVFGYSGDSLLAFKKRIDEQEIAPIYKKLISEEDNRLFVKIDVSQRETLDVGWTTFQSMFSDFCKQFSITYENFYENRFTIGKQSKRLFRACKEFYKEKLSEYVLECMFQGVSSDSLPKKELYLVLSCNLNDFILCSTGNSWTSCLNLEDGCYWPSLSGFLLDKNRAMIYVTDLTEKNFKGVTSFKMTERSWCLLSNKNEIINSIAYPRRDIFNLEYVSKMFGVEVKKQESKFESKYQIVPIFNDNKVFSYGYQDETRLVFKDNKLTLDGDNYGCESLTINFFGDKEVVEFDELYEEIENYSDIDGKEYKSISDLFLCSCVKCGKKESSIFFIQELDGYVCKECFDKEALTCCECDKPYKKKFITIHDDIICEKCKKKEEYVKCPKCKKYHIGNGEEICEYCQSSLEIKKCDKCQEYFDEPKVSFLNTVRYLPLGKKAFVPVDKTGCLCDNCLSGFLEKKNIVLCDNTGRYHEKDKTGICNICGDVE